MSDDPNIRGGEPSEEPHERIGMSGSDPLWAPGVGMVSPPTPRPQDFESGSTATPWMNQGANPSIPTYASVSPQQQMSILMSLWTAILCLVSQVPLETAGTLYPHLEPREWVERKSSEILGHHSVPPLTP